MNKHGSLKHLELLHRLHILFTEYQEKWDVHWCMYIRYSHCLQDPFQIRGPEDGPHAPMLWENTAYEYENKVVRRAKMPLCSAYFTWFNCIILIWVHYSLVCYSNKLHCSLKQWWLKIEIVYCILYLTGMLQIWYLPLAMDKVILERFSLFG